MEKKSAKYNTYTVVAVAIMTAMVFASNYIQIPIPTVIGTTRIHIANGICLLAALLLGGFKGGIAAGLGSFFFDLTFPEYVPLSWVTFLTKFTMALICGLIVYMGSKQKSDKPVSVWRRLVGTVVGALSYVAMFVAQQFFVKCLIEKQAVEAVAIATFTVKLPTSLLNAALAVPIAILLHSALRPALQKAKLSDKFGIK